MFLEKLFKHSVVLGFPICEKKVLAGPDTWGCRMPKGGTGQHSAVALALGASSVLGKCSPPSASAVF